MFDTSHLHPLLVHFPIALIIVGFFADVVFLFFKSEKCLSKTGFYLMVLGALAAIAAWTTGQLFTDEPSQGEIAKVFERHETGALINNDSYDYRSFTENLSGNKKEGGNKPEMDCFYSLPGSIFNCILYRIYGRDDGL